MALWSRHCQAWLHVCMYMYTHDTLALTLMNSVAYKLISRQLGTIYHNTWLQCGSSVVLLYPGHMCVLITQLSHDFTTKFPDCHVNDHVILNVDKMTSKLRVDNFDGFLRRHKAPLSHCQRQSFRYFCLFSRWTRSFTFKSTTKCAKRF